MTAKNKAVIKGEITYHDTEHQRVGIETAVRPFAAIRLHGIVDPMFFTAAPTARRRPRCFLDAAQFEAPTGPRTRSDSPRCPAEFTVLVFDQGEPGRTNDPAFVTGDGFSIELAGGPYTLYTRAGYIEGGNIQVDIPRHSTGCRRRGVGSDHSTPLTRARLDSIPAGHSPPAVISVHTTGSLRYDYRTDVTCRVKQQSRRWRTAPTGRCGGD